MGWVISGHQEFLFLAIWWARHFFPFFSHKLSITFLLHAIFFPPTSAWRKFFFKITHPLPQELNGRPLMRSFKLLINKKINMKEKDKRNEFLMSR